MTLNLIVGIDRFFQSAIVELTQAVQFTFTVQTCFIKRETPSLGICFHQRAKWNYIWIFDGGGGCPLLLCCSRINCIMKKKKKYIWILNVCVSVGGSVSGCVGMVLEREHGGKKREKNSKGEREYDIWSNIFSWNHFLFKIIFVPLKSLREISLGKFV